MEKSTKQQRLAVYRQIRELLKELGDIDHAEGNGYLFMAIERKDSERFTQIGRCAGTKDSLGTVTTRLMTNDPGVKEAIITAALTQVVKLGCIEVQVECQCPKCIAARDKVKHTENLN